VFQSFIDGFGEAYHPLLGEIKASFDAAIAAGLRYALDNSEAQLQLLAAERETRRQVAAVRAEVLESEWGWQPRGLLSRGACSCKPLPRPCLVQHPVCPATQAASSSGSSCTMPSQQHRRGWVQDSASLTLLPMTWLKQRATWSACGQQPRELAQPNSGSPTRPLQRPTGSRRDRTLQRCSP
jgi:hypothetical protein